MKSYTFTMKATVSFDAGDEVIMSIAGHVLRDRLSRYARKKYTAVPIGACWVDIDRQVIAHMSKRGRQPEFSAMPRSSDLRRACKRAVLRPRGITIEKRPRSKSPQKLCYA